MARCDPEEPFTYKTRSEQRLEWLKTRSRPLADEEADELYRALHAIYVRDCRRHNAELEGTTQARGESRKENAELLAKVQTEARRSEL